MSEEILRGDTYSKSAIPFIGRGSEYLLLTNKYTAYQGLITRKQNKTYKILDYIDLHEEIIRTHTTKDTIHCYTKHNKYVITVNDGYVEIKPTYQTKITLVADCRYTDSTPAFGRNYEVSFSKNITHVTYTHNDERFDFTIQGHIEEYLENWVKKEYAYDKRRGEDGERYVYELGVFTASQNSPLEIAWYTEQTPYHHRMHQFLYQTDRKRLCAGYPWFQETWARDEVISVEPYIRRGEHTVAKEILLSYIGKKDVSSVIGGDLPSADTQGWLARRLIQLDNKKSLTEKESKRIYAHFTSYIEDKTDSTGLIHNEDLETWMDTAGGTDDTRRGYCVEIQFGLLAMYELLTKLSSRINKDPKEHELNHVKKVIKKLFVKDNLLHDRYVDGSVDKTKRPNVFLAWYLYPQGIRRKIWMKTFKDIIHHCWCDWGGLTSIGKNDEKYHPRYTGKNNKSYHRGDSWYYVNNIAAIAMYNIAKHTFMKHIHKIHEASLKDWEHLGAIGACSEISSAEKQTGEGTFSQAWSMATLDELNKVLR